MAVNNKDMDVRVSIKYSSIDIRVKPTTASDKIEIENIDTNIEYKATKYIKGWYYISDFKGWVKVVDVIKRKVYSWGDYGEGTTTDPEKPTDSDIVSYDPNELIKAINQASNYIQAGRIFVLIDNKQIILDTLLKSLDNTLTDMENVVTKVGKMETIPLINEFEEGTIPVVVGELDEYTKEMIYSIKWTKLSFDQLENIPRIFTVNEW